MLTMLVNLILMPSFALCFFILDKLALEGIVVQRAECRPAASENYMKLKR